MGATEINNEAVNPWIVINKSIEKYLRPSLGRSIWQIANTFIPYAGLVDFNRLQPFSFILAYGFPDCAGSRISGTAVYYFPRLRARVVL